MSFEEKIQQGIYPSAEQIIFLHTKNLTRAEICEQLHISPSTYKKLRRYYKISPKKHIVKKEDYKIRVQHAQGTLNQRYGEKGSETRAEFYKQNQQKAYQTCLQKYGVGNASNLEFVKEKRKQTILKLYGVENAIQYPEFLIKAQQTNLERYGSLFSVTSDVILQKIKATILAKYGNRSEMSLQSTPLREKTNMERYGYPCCLQNPDIIEKGNQHMLQLGKNVVPTSKQQLYINNLFGGQLNYPFGPYHVDCYLIKDNIAVEYSGGGHNLQVTLGNITQEKFNQRERSRHSYFRNKNIPILEFISKKDILPSDSVLIQYLEYAKQQFSLGSLYVCVNIDNNQIINA